MSQQPDARDPRPDSLEVLWIGDPGPAGAFLAGHAPRVAVTTCEASAAMGAVPSGVTRADLLVIDATVDGFDVARFIGQLEFHQVERPIVLLVGADTWERLAQTSHLATYDCVVKTPDFVLQLLPAFNQSRARHDLRVRLRAAQESQARLRGILELQPAVTCVLDRHGILSAMNEAGRAMLATGPAPVVGQPLAKFISAGDQAAVAELIGRVCQGEPLEMRVTFVRGDGGTVDACLRALPFQRGEHIVALATIEARPDAAVIPPETAAERDGLASALRRAESEVAQLRAERDEWHTARDLLDTRLRSALNEVAAAQERERLIATLQHQLSDAVEERMRLETKVREASGRWALALSEVAADNESLRRAHARTIPTPVVIAAEPTLVTGPARITRGDEPPTRRVSSEDVERPVEDHRESLIPARHAPAARSDADQADLHPEAAASEPTGDRDRAGTPPDHSRVHSDPSRTSENQDSLDAERADSRPLNEQLAELRKLMASDRTSFQLLLDQAGRLLRDVRNNSDQ